MTLPKHVRDALPDQPGDPVGPVTPGTGATDLGKAEGQTAVAGDVGVAMLVYNDSDGKYRWLPVYDAEVPNTLKRGPMVFGWDPLNAVPVPLAVESLDGAGRLILSAVGVVTVVGVVTANVQGIPFGAVWAGNSGGVPGGFETQDSTNVVLNTAGQVGAGRVTSRGDQWIRNPSALILETFAATGNGATTNASMRPFRNFSIQVVPTGAVTSWDVRLEGSLDNTNFTTILTHTNVDGGGVVKPLTTPFPCMYTRLRCAGLVLGAGTNIVCYGVGIQ